MATGSLAVIFRIACIAALPVLSWPPELPSRLARDIEKTGEEDHRNAYSGVGVLAMVPLLVDSVRKDGCRW